MKTYNIRIPIGDWSDDGHGKCQWYVVKSNKPLQALFDAFFIAKEKLPEEIHVDNICHKYQENTITQETCDQLIKNGFGDWVEETKKNGMSGSEYYVYSNNMLSLLLLFLRVGDNELKLKVIKDNDSFICWNDKKRRDMNSFGYGLFD